jgi:hypothetical protein
LPDHLGVLETPQTEVEASLWMQVGTERGLQGRPLSSGNLRSLCLVADHFAETDPDNAFWLQMGAVFESMRGNRQAAYDRWERASHATHWHDYQAERLSKLVQSMASETGGRMAWHYARAIRLRTNRPSRLVEVYAKSLLTSADLDTEAGLKVRMVALRNGKLLRDGAGSLEAGNAGVRTIECSSLPVVVLRQFSPRGLQLARFQFVNRLREHGMPDDATLANNAFRLNEAWLAMTGQQDPEEFYAEHAYGSVAFAVLPGASLILAVIGAILAMIGTSIQRFPAVQTVFRAPYVQIVGLTLALTAYAATGLVLVALTVALCFAFTSFSPERSRTRPPEYLGPFFRFTLLVLGTAFSVLVLLFITGLTMPALEVLSAMEISPEFYGGQTLPLGLAGLVAGLTLLVGPSWALVLRIPTPSVIGKAVFEFGMTVSLFGLIVAIAFAPIALTLDAGFAETLRKMLISEPIYYLRQ